MTKTHVFRFVCAVALILACVTVGKAQTPQSCSYHAVLNSVTTDATGPTPTATPTGGSATTWTYKVVGCLARSTTLNATGVGTCVNHSAAGTAGTTTVGAATLNTSTAYNTVAWTNTTGVTDYDIYRTASGGTPSSLGLVASIAAGVGYPSIANVSASSINDMALTGDTSTAPTTNTSVQTVALVPAPSLQNSPPVYNATTGQVLSNPANGGQIYVCDVYMNVTKVSSLSFGLVAGSGQSCVGAGFSVVVPVTPLFPSGTIGPLSTNDIVNIHWGVLDAIQAGPGYGVCAEFTGAQPNSVSQAVISYAIL